MTKTKRAISLVLAVMMLLSTFVGLNLTALAADGDGWQKVDGVWYYVKDGENKTGWLKDGGKWYYLDPDSNGVMLANTYEEINGKNYVFSKSGAMLADGWNKLSETYSYIDDETGEKVSETYTVWFYLNKDGSAKTGWLRDKGVWYYLDPDNCGIMVANEPMRINDKIYVFSQSGAMLTYGWQSLKVTASIVSSEMQEYTVWWWINQDGSARTGWLKTGGKWYYLEPYYGVMVNDAVIPVPIDADYDKDTDIYAFNKNGAMITNSWYKETYSDMEYKSTLEPVEEYIGSSYTEWYYLGADGKAYKGWHQIKSTWYYFDPYDAIMCASDWIEGAKSTDENPVWYYVNANGAMVTGWCDVAADNGEDYNEWHYFDKNGVEQYGWQTIKGKTYYFDKSGEMVTGWQKIDGEMYYFAKNGAYDPTQKWDPQ